MEKMKVIELTTLVPNPENPNHMSAERFTALKKSIKDFPKLLRVNPIVARPSDRMILSGNHRVRALIELGMFEVPAEWVQWSEDFDPVEEKRAIVVLNQIFGKMDAEELLAQFGQEALADWGVEVDALLDEIETKAAEAHKTEIELPGALDGTESHKPYVVKLTFHDKATLDRFLSDEVRGMIDSFGAKISVSGGEL